MSEFIAAFYIFFFAVYSLGGVAVLIYAARVHKSIKRIEEEAKQARLRECSHGNESTHKSDPTVPLLGAVYPKDQDFKDMIV